MPTFECRCGNKIEIVPPSLHAGYMVWDSDVDQAIDQRNAIIRSFLYAVQSGKRESWMKDFYGRSTLRSGFTARDNADVIEDILSEQDTWTRHVFRCPVCKRLYIQNSTRSDEFQCYLEESD